MPEMEHVAHQAARDAAVALSRVDSHIEDCVEHRRSIARQLTNLDGKADTIEQRVLSRMEQTALEGMRGRKQIMLTLLAGFLSVAGGIGLMWLQAHWRH